jgi:hypothetical protein
MSDVDFDRVIDAARKEVALAPVADSLAGLRISDARPAADRERPARRHATAPMARVRRLGERQKRYR